MRPILIGPARRKGLELFHRTWHPDVERFLARLRRRKAWTECITTAEAGCALRFADMWRASFMDGNIPEGHRQPAMGGDQYISGFPTSQEYLATDPGTRSTATIACSPGIHLCAGAGDGGTGSRRWILTTRCLNGKLRHGGHSGVVANSRARDQRQLYSRQCELQLRSLWRDTSSAVQQARLQNGERAEVSAVHVTLTTDIPTFSSDQRH